MVLKANDRRISCPCHDEFRGPCSDYVRQVALATTTTTKILYRLDMLSKNNSHMPPVNRTRAMGDRLYGRKHR
ncbi:hypothetical protein TNCV_822301 [Trichonephila clavipes]|nr:hypothetical protein TNCV_822301 [Trichonephila clavipes]